MTKVHGTGADKLEVELKRIGVRPLSRTVKFLFISSCRRADTPFDKTILVVFNDRGVISDTDSVAVLHHKMRVLRIPKWPNTGGLVERRRLLLIPAISLTIGSLQYSLEKGAAKAEFTDMPALRGKDYGKTKMSYPDYTETESGLQYKVHNSHEELQDLRVGEGPSPKKGETVVIDWDGYTIGYYGRIFEARNKTKGGSFEGGDKEFFKFKVGSGQVIPAFEEAMTGMRPGGVRRIIVPPDIGYPDNDLNKLGPKPTTFSGQRALDFVLRNQGLIDKTLLFDIELIRIIPSQ
ncbi:putative FKBP-type peptidyl-prolyl cis-trans isomerase 7, chloroplastic [Triticum urartu]|uniref:peptidylprolyl isomerase n=1 Tax=Triticum urartu TaxID=4572 RepID=M8AVE9_TRIUA|nr:putative FKBP-type peptidyl-prolyl cis-trans isomerase 7, chloroplastic [Triticum urartu]